MYLKEKNFSGEIIETNKCKFIKTVKYWLKKKYNENFSLPELNKIIKFRKKL